MHYFTVLRSRRWGSQSWRGPAFQRVQPAESRPPSRAPDPSYEATGDPKYRAGGLRAAARLKELFNPLTNLVSSWRTQRRRHHDESPDLWWAARETKDAWTELARKHALNSAEWLVRSDNRQKFTSSERVMDYPNHAAPCELVFTHTHQALAANTAWSRGPSTASPKLTARPETPRHRREVRRLRHRSSARARRAVVRLRRRGRLLPQPRFLSGGDPRRRLAPPRTTDRRPGAPEGAVPLSGRRPAPRLQHPSHDVRLIYGEYNLLETLLSRQHAKIMSTTNHNVLGVS
jgi:hypothetical protein